MYREVEEYIHIIYIYREREGDRYINRQADRWRNEPANPNKICS